MPRKFSLLTLFFIFAACAPVDYSTSYPAPITQIPFFASETPAPFVVPVTNTPVILPQEPVTNTPIFIEPLSVTETPIVIPTTNKWWEVYFTDPQTINNPDVIAGSKVAQAAASGWARGLSASW